MHAYYVLLAVLPVDLALHFHKGARLDQQTLSFIAASAFAEAYHHGVPRAFCLDPAREQRIPGRQKFEIVEAGASQACRAGTFHDKQIARSAASVAFPGIAQWLDDQKLGPTARSLHQTLLPLLRKLARNPMGAVQLLDRRTPALAEAQRLPQRRPRDVGRLAWD